MPSGTFGVRWTSDDGRDDLNFVMDAWNGGQWGYNNLQWIGLTYYHKLNDYWHIAFETWNIHENNVPNLNNATANAASLPVAVRRSARNYARSTPRMRRGARRANSVTQCGRRSADLHRRRADLPPLHELFAEQVEQLLAAYRVLQRSEGPADGSANAYADVALSWQHWLSPQIEFRPEIAYYRRSTPRPSTATPMRESLQQGTGRSSRRAT